MINFGMDPQEVEGIAEEIVDKSAITWEYPEPSETGPLSLMPELHSDILNLSVKLDVDFPPFLEQVLSHPLYFSIRSLVISDRELSGISGHLGNFSRLTELDLSYNALSDLPKEMANLTQLESLMLTRNNFAEIPEVVLNLPALKELSLSKNAISKLPEFSTSHFPSLRSLRIAGNLIEEVPESICNLTTLRRLMLTENYLSSLPSSLENMPNLMNLDIRKNPRLIHVSPSLFAKLGLGLESSLPNELIEGKLFIGDWDTAHSGDILAARKIRYILSVCDEKPKIDSNRFVHKWLQLSDHPGVTLNEYFKECFEFINQGTVLCHCAVGASRSATVCIAYIMQDQKLGFEEALKKVKAIRPIVSPNNGFVRQLQEFEKTMSIMNNK